MTATEGKNIVLLWRKLSDQTKMDAKLMVYETDHEVKLSADGESVKTKFATINTSSSTEEEVSFTSYADSQDSIYAYLEKAMLDQEKLEMWELNLTDENGEFKEKQKYPAKYRQGVLTELNSKNPTDGYMEIDGTFKTDFVRQEGEATFTAEQLEAVAYVFEDTTKKSEELSEEL